MHHPSPATWLTPVRATVALGVAAATLLIVARPFGLGWEASVIAALTVLSILLWATNALPPYLVSIQLMLVAVLLRAAPPEVAFSGFTSTAFWLVFGGLIIGAAVDHVGFAQRIATLIARHTGSRYPLLIFGLVAFGTASIFIIPSSMGRVVLLIPVLAALAQSFGFQRSDNGFAGIMLAGILGSYLPSFAVLTGNVPNLILAGAAQDMFGYPIGYLEYLAAHFPLLGLGRAAVVVLTILWLFPAQLPATPPEPPPHAHRSDPKREWLFAGIILITLLLWVTNAWHGISTGWVAAAAGLVIVLTGVFPIAQIPKSINFTVLFFVAGIITLGRLIAGSEISPILATIVTTVLPLSPNTPFLNYIVLVSTSSLVSVFTTVPTAPALLTTVAAQVSAASGFDLSTTVLLEAVGYGLVWFPFQAPPLVVGLVIGGLPPKPVARSVLTIGLATALILVPANFLWWHILGRV